MNKPNLLPCPFCAGPAAFVYRSGIIATHVFVKCSKCGAKTKPYSYSYGTEKDEAHLSASYAWNNRA